MASLTLPLAARPGAARLVLAIAAAPLLLLVARALPDEGPGLALRLAAAVACVLLLPGALVLRAVSWPSSPALAAAAAVALSLAILFAALALTFAFGASIRLTGAVVAAVAAAALVPAARATEVVPVRSEFLASAAVLAASLPFAGLVWWVARAPQGDALFHLARVRKLAELPALGSVNAVNEFADGGPHPGYAFPLWHGALALVTRLAGVDATEVIVHVATVLVPLSFLVAYAAGSALFRSWSGGAAVLAAQVAQLGFSRAGTGSFEFLALPATATRLLLVPATLALAFAFLRSGERAVLAALAAAALAAAVIHPTYALFLAVPLAGFLAVRLIWERGERRRASRIAAAVAAVLVPSGLFVVWLLPFVRSTASYRPSAGERARALAHYAGQVDVSGDSFRLAPEAITRAGPVVVGALLAFPLAALAARRMSAAFVVGGSLAVLAALVVSPLFTALADVVSLSQARRLAAFLPVPFALAAAAVLLARFRLLAVAGAVLAGLLLVLAYPGELSYRLREGGPTWPVWLALGAGLAAIVVGAVFRRAGPTPGRWAAAAAVGFVVPIAVAGLGDLERSDRPDHYALTPGVIGTLRSLDPGTVVFSDLEGSYRAAAYAPVRVAAVSPAHAADTKANRPYERRRDVFSFFYRRATSDAKRREILARSGADWLLVDKTRLYPERFARSLQLVYEDDRYALFRTPGR